MIRDLLCNKDYWDQWVSFGDSRITQMQDNLQTPAGDPSYEPQYVAELSQTNWEQIIRRYSRGDPIDGLAVYFPPMLDAWEESERLGKSVWTPAQMHIRHTWAVNIDCYHGHFWKIALALLLDIPEDQWQRLIALVGNEGEDILLDRLIASRSPERRIGTELCFPKPYARLLAAIEAPPARQAKLLKGFLDHWYAELGRYAKHARVPQLNPYTEPYWYTFAKHNLMGGAYFGQWCLEAAAAVKAFGLDDNLCLGHRHYPGDFLRPQGPSTHPVRPDVLAPSDPTVSTPDDDRQPPGFFARLFGKR